jgi:hypothetical protein
VRNYPDHNLTLAQALHNWRRGGADRIDYELEIDRDWESPPRCERLAVTYEFKIDETGEDAVAIRAHLGEHSLDLQCPVRLGPARIKKPWGEEIWYTAIEARGESTVITPAGEVSLATYLSLAPDRLCRRQPIILLKVLNPKPEPITGELYFEVHEEKREVYVVTHVDATAWPDGVGYIRLGMNQEVRGRFRDDDAFRAAFLKAVKNYESIRKRVDAGAASEALGETSAREQVESFSVLQPLVVGDVVVVPTWLPHCLQHGVRVVEFQTPTYERHIISFDQQVLTQDQWDSATAISQMRLDVPIAATFDTVAPGVECIVTFDDFAVWRVQLAGGAEFPLPADLPYAVCMALGGEIAISTSDGTLSLAHEQAAFVPAAASAAKLVNSQPRAVSCLIAAPGL